MSCRVNYLVFAFKSMKWIPCNLPSFSVMNVLSMKQLDLSWIPELLNRHLNLLSCLHWISQDLSDLKIGGIRTLLTVLLISATEKYFFLKKSLMRLKWHTRTYKSKKEYRLLCWKVTQLLFGEDTVLKGPPLSFTFIPRTPVCFQHFYLSPLIFLYGKELLCFSTAIEVFDRRK